MLFQFLQAFAKAYHWHIEPSGSLFETGTTCCCEKLYGQLIINWQIIQYVRTVRNNAACICFILCNHSIPLHSGNLAQCRLTFPYLDNIVMHRSCVRYWQAFISKA